MHTTKLILFFALTYFTPILIIDFVLLNEIDYINYFVKSVPSKLLEDYVDAYLTWRWFGYLVTFIIVLVKTLIVSCFIWLATFLTNKSLPYNSIWRITILSQLVFALKNYILLGKVIVIHEFNLSELEAYHPLSIASIYNTQSLKTHLIFLFQSINLFEVAYWLVLAYLLAKVLKSTFNYGISLVLCAYLPSFCLWLLTITFLLVSNG